MREVEITIEEGATFVVKKGRRVSKCTYLTMVHGLVESESGRARRKRLLSSSRLIHRSRGVLSRDRHEP